MPRSWVPLLAATLLVIAAVPSTAVEPLQPSACNTTFDIYNPDVNEELLLDAFRAVATHGEKYGIAPGCLASALTNLSSCQTDLTKLSGCCTQQCWDTFRKPYIRGRCLNAVVRGVCRMADDNINGTSDFLSAFFFTYSNCVELTRLPYNCATFGRPPPPIPPLSAMPTPAPSPVEGVGYPPVYGAGYPPLYGVGYPPVYGVGYPPVYGVGYPPYYGVGYPPYYGVGYPSVYGVGYPPVYVGGSYPPTYGGRPPMPSLPARRHLRQSLPSRHASSVSSSELKRLRQEKHRA